MSICISAISLYLLQEHMADLLPSWSFQCTYAPHILRKNGFFSVKSHHMCLTYTFCFLDHLSNIGSFQWITCDITFKNLILQSSHLYTFWCHIELWIGEVFHSLGDNYLWLMLDKYGHTVCNSLPQGQSYHHNFNLVPPTWCLGDHSMELSPSPHGQKFSRWSSYMVHHTQTLLYP